MSDSGDDWLANADSEEEDQKKDQKKKFDDEDTVDSEAIKKQKDEEAKKLQKEKELAAKAENAINQEQNKKRNYEDMWQQRQKDIPTEVKVDTKGKTNAEIGLATQIAAESNMTAQLFGADEEDGKKVAVKDWKLNSEKDYKEFGKHTAKILYKGSTPYRVENFFRELCRDLPEHCDAKQIGGIVDYMKSVFNQKQKAEKEERDGKNKKKKKTALAGGGAKGYERNNNPAMVNDVMGAGVEDDDYGDYGDENGAGFRREGEADFDFM